MKFSGSALQLDLIEFSIHPYGSVNCSESSKWVLDCFNIGFEVQPDRTHHGTARRANCGGANPHAPLQYERTRLLHA